MREQDQASESHRRARFLGTGPLAIIVNVVLLLPDVALLINRRNYIGLTNVLLLNYFLRNEQSLTEEEATP